MHYVNLFRNETETREGKEGYFMISSKAFINNLPNAKGTKSC